MALRIWLPLNKDTNVIPDITGFSKEGSVTLTADTDGWYKVSDSSHTSSRWGIYKDFNVKPNTKYTLCVYSKSTTGVTAGVAVGSMATNASWPSNVDTNATSTEKLKTYSWTTGSNHTIARVYLNISCTSTVANNYVFFKDPAIYEDPNNQGLSNINITTTGKISYTNEGKIGSGLLTDGSTFFTVSPITLGTEASVALWVKTTDTNAMFWVLNASVYHSFNFWLNGNSYYLNTGDGSGNPFRNNGTNVTSLHDGLWHHYAITFDGTSCKLYIDGIYRGAASTYKSPATPNNSTIKIAGGFSNGHSYDTNGTFNDFRVYDHCLSPKEVKEISKGLVLHYKLDDKTLLSRENLITSLSGGGQCTISNNVVTVSGNNSDTYFYIRTPRALTLNKVYRISCVGNFADGIFYKFPIGAQNNTSQGLLKVQNGYCSLIFVANSTIVDKGTNIILDDTTRSPGAGTISNLVLEELNDVYDCSGYEYNGTVLGALTVSNDTLRYDYSSVFDGDTSGILIENLNISNVINTALTYSFWIKPDGENGARSVYFGSYSGASFSIEKTTTNKLRLWWNGSHDLTSTLYITDGQWQHIAITKNGTTEIKIYLNGVLTQTLTNTYNNVTFPTTYRIGRDIRTGATSYKGLMSDFRIYATALSAEDVLELYNTAASVDNKGNVFSYEFNEKAINLFSLENWNLNARTAVQWTARNGEDAVQLNANNFYYGSGDDRNRCFNDLFLPNTQYMFDMWIDYDDIVYDNVNRQGGISITYTDGTVSYALCDVGDYTNHAGWKHKVFYSDPSKSIKCLSIYYWTATGAFYRWDSVIVPVLYNIDINKNGILNGSVFNENSDIVQFHKSAVVSNSQLIEK